MTDEYTRWFQHRKKKYRVRFLRRPFREGLEAIVEHREGASLRIAELGLGEKALIARAKRLLDDMNGRVKNPKVKGAAGG